jgi:hypothetical protein
VGGERGKIGQTKISSKGDKEREQLPEPKVSVSALKIKRLTTSAFSITYFFTACTAPTHFRV